MRSFRAHGFWTERQWWERPAEGAGALARAAREGRPGWERVASRGLERLPGEAVGSGRYQGGARRYRKEVVLGPAAPPM